MLCLFWGWPDQTVRYHSVETPRVPNPVELAVFVFTLNNAQKVQNILILVYTPHLSRDAPEPSN